MNSIKYRTPSKRQKYFWRGLEKFLHHRIFPVGSSKAVIRVSKADSDLKVKDIRINEVHRKNCASFLINADHGVSRVFGKRSALSEILEEDLFIQIARKLLRNFFGIRYWRKQTIRAKHRTDKTEDRFPRDRLMLIQAECVSITCLRLHRFAFLPRNIWCLNCTMQSQSNIQYMQYSIHISKRRSKKLL